MHCALHLFFHYTTHRNQIHSTNSRKYAHHKRKYVEALKQMPGKSSPNIFKFKHRKTGIEFEGTRQEFIKFSGLTPQELYNITSGALRWSKQWGVFDANTGKYSFERIKQPCIQQPIKCEHCGKVISPSNYSKWHGNNCKVFSPKNFEKQSRQIKNLYKNRKSKKLNI